jgi:hypothetical protein
MAAIDIEYDLAALEPLTVSQRYVAEMGIIHLFEEMELPGPERTRLITDGLTTIQDLVNQYGYDIKSFKDYIICYSSK